MWEFFQRMLWTVPVYFITNISTYVTLSSKYDCHTLVLIITSVFEFSTLKLKYIQGQGTFGKVARLVLNIHNY